MVQLKEHYLSYLRGERVTYFLRILLSWGILQGSLYAAEPITSLWRVTEVQSGVPTDLQGQALANADKVKLEAVSIQINMAAMLALAEGQRIEAAINASAKLSAEVVSRWQKNGMQIVEARNSHYPQLPNALFFITPDGVSAWLPTHKGTYRLRNGVLRKELKASGTRPDFLIPQGQKNTFNSVLSNAFFASSAAHLSTYQVSRPRTAPVPDSARAQSTQESTIGNKAVKVLFVVTDQFVANYPNTSEYLDEWVITNNAIYQASHINIEIVNAGFHQSNIESVTESHLLNVISDNAGAASRELEAPLTLPMLEAIWQARVATQADFVAILKYNQVESLCGLGWVNGSITQDFFYDYAVNVTIDSFAFNANSSAPCGFDTLGHELGHNMGLGHSQAQGSVGTVFSYGRGYGVRNDFSTVMAYPSAFGSAQGINLYSSPDLDCNGLPCGIDRTVSDGADAVNAINEVAAVISRLYDETNPNFALPDALANVTDDTLRSCIQGNISIETVVAQVLSVACPNVDSIAGLAAFKDLVFVNLRNSTALDDISPLASIANISTLDLINTHVSDVRPLAAIRNELDVFLLGSDNISCQQINVLENGWALLDFQYSGTCLSLPNDDEDFDNDGLTNLVDLDDDNDGLDDLTDALPFDASNVNDADGDGVVDDLDAFPFDSTEQTDTDNDGIGNNADLDDDNDGMPDEYEARYNLNALDASDAANDDDNDGLTNLEEFQQGTHPLDSDTDNDGVNDGDEVAAGTDPLSGGEGLSAPRADFNGDGFADLLYRDDSSLQWSIHLHNRNQTTITDHVSGMSLVSSWQYNGTGDFDGDGNDDVIIRNSQSGFWYIYNMVGGDITRRGYIGIADASQLKVQAVADFNRDGMDDVLLRNVNTGEWQISLVNDKSLIADISPPMSRVTTWHIVSASDFDGNGSPDILIRNALSGAWYVYLYDGINIIGRGYITSLTSDLAEQVQGVADFDGDGVVDVLLRHGQTQEWRIVFMNGLAPIGTVAIGLPSDSQGVFHTADDFDRDGRADVVLRSDNALTIYYLNGVSIMNTELVDTSLSPDQRVKRLN